MMNLGSIMKSFPKKSDLSVQANAIMPLLIRMLKDESPDNRAKAAEALSFLHSISWFSTWFTTSFLHNSIFISSYFSQFIFTSVCHQIFFNFFFRGLVKWVDWLESDSSLVYWNDWRHQLPSQLQDTSRSSAINQTVCGEIRFLEKDAMLNITSCRYVSALII